MSSKEGHVYNVNDCLIEGITVYQDRAEVTRNLLFIPQILGQHEIIINSVTLSSDPESIRVRGNGSCEILEVAHDIRTDKVEVAKSNVKELLDKIKEEEKLQKSITQEISRLSNQRRLTQTYSDTILGKGKLKEDVSLGLDDARNILQFYADEMLRFDNLEVQLDERLTAVNESLTLLRNELKDLRHVNSQATIEKKRSITILVNVQELNEINLIVTYVVSNSTWIPSYDLRMNSVQNTMDIYYYAEVIQSCGENWNDCNICLSTSNPAIGSSPPVLPLRTIDWSWNCQPRYTGNKNSINLNMKSSLSTRRKSEYLSENYSDEGNYNAREGSFSLMEDEPRSIGGNNNNNNNNFGGGGPGSGGENNNQLNANDAGSTTFVIPRKVTIESDNKPHKVTVIITSFTPQIVHYVAASMSAFVYLQAKIQNTSIYPLLPSEKVSVFLDGNFVSVTSIKQTSPGEFFNVFLGVDPSVKVQYMPVRTAQYTKGWLSGTEVKKYFYSTVIHNTKQRPIRVIIAEILPRASDEKITIELLEPSPSSLSKASNETSPILNEQDVIAGLDGFGSNNDTSNNGNNGNSGEASNTRSTQTWPRDFVTQNKFTNNIVWLKTIQGGEKTEIKFAYRVAWPQGQTIGIR